MLAQVTQTQEKSTLLVEVCRITDFKDAVKKSSNCAKYALFKYFLNERITSLIYFIHKLTKKISCF